MSEPDPALAKLEKKLRVLERKLERSKWHRADLENQHDRDQHLYRRLHADLEAARREAEVEAALERTRAQSLQMRHSSELVATSAVFHEQLLGLGVPTEFSYVWLPDEAAGKHQFWATWTEDDGGEPVHRSRAVTYDLDKSEPYTAACFAAWESDDRLLVDFIPPDGVEHFFETWGELLGSADHLRPEHFPDGLYYAEGYMRYGCFGINIRREPTETEREVLQRFSLEFERAYTRFLDLQKAEAQAREAQIEAALERVRARAMGMQTSDELQDVIQVVRDQIVSLEIHADHAGFIMDYKNRDDMHIWLADENEVPTEVFIPYFDSPHWNSFREAQKSGKRQFVNQLDFDTKNNFYNGLFDLIPGVPDEAREFYLRCPGLSISTVLLDDVGLYIENFSARPYTDEENGTLMRFGKVFQQAYTRFLDLQRAEQQAREAQIEAALERVRSRAMGMRSSDELREMVLVILKEMKALAFPSGRCTIVLFDRETGDSHFWMSGLTDADLPERYHVPYHELPTYTALHDGWRQGIPFFEIELAGEVKREQDRFFHEETEFSRLPEPAKEGMRSIGDLWLSNAATTHGIVQAVGPEPLSEDNAAILRRFAKVIDLTYTRVEDIQQSEAQVREAQIEAAVERVRSRALAMTTSDELLDVAFEIRKQFAGLGLECGAFWHTRYTPEAYHKALTSLDGKKLAAVMELPRDFASNPDLAAWEHGDEPVGVFPFDAEAGAEYMHHMATKGKFSEIDPEAITVEMVREHGGITFVQARTSHGEIGYSLWGEAEPTEEATSVLVRFATAFDLAYRRFEDLQQAEADHRALLEEKALTEQALVELRATQAQLIQAEKMASLGALTAGIAHEIKNPLNFVTNFASLSQELVAELADETDPEEREALLADLKANAAKIEEHGRRADGIVRSMMAHARSGTGERRAVDLNGLVAEYAAHAEHAAKVKRPDAAPVVAVRLGDGVGEVALVPQEIGRVLVNLVDNALDAVRQRAEADGPGYAPTVTVSTARTDAGVEVRVTDNGPGMAPDVAAKVFEPFFTTKPTGQGTGLGLSLSHDIVTQGHGGALTVESREGAGATFVLALPTPDRP